MAQPLTSMLTDREIKLIKQSWGELRGVDPVNIGDVFYRKLFIDLPEAKHMFKTSREEQSKKLVDMLSLIVARLDRSGEITDEIKQLGKRHALYGVKEIHYTYVGNALIWMLKQALRSSWNKEKEAAWIKCYQWMADTMISASKK